jgi:branched-chain amino acid transport system substrate-binding protein
VISADGNIVVGVSAALTGLQAQLGQDLADAVDLAIEEFGRPIAGHAVRSVRADDGCNDSEMATEAATRLVANEGLAGIVGPMCTTGAQAANDVYEAAGVIHVTASATRESLSEQGEQFFFRSAWRDDVQAHVQAAYALDELDEGTAVVIEDGDPYGKALAEAFVQAYESGGGDVLSRERIKRGDTDFSALARQIVSAAPGVVVFEGLDPEAALFLRDLNEEGFEGTFMGPDSLLNTRDFIVAGGAATEGAIISAGIVPDTAFIERFQARFGRIPSTSFVLQAYDATRALLVALDGHTAGSSGELSIERDELASALRARTLTGMTGTIRFDEVGDRSGDSPREAGLAIYRVTNGAFEQVE